MTLESHPPMPRTPLEALGPVQREQVLVEDRMFLIERPGDSDRVIDLGAERYVPYWAELWPAARMLAKWIVKQSWPAGLHALEIGCGLGLPGMAALARGVRVTFSDYDATALYFASHNARLNQFEDFDTLQLDWRYPPEGLRYRVLLAADLIYEARSVEPLVELIEKLLAPDGVCLLTDLDRVPGRLLQEALTLQGLEYATQMVRSGEPGGRRLKGLLYRIFRPGLEQSVLPINMRKVSSTGSQGAK
jgi:predicted nicotinamide N-methyase